MGLLEAAAFFVLLPAPARTGIIPADFPAHREKDTTNGRSRTTFRAHFSRPLASPAVNSILALLKQLEALEKRVLARWTEWEKLSR